MQVINLNPVSHWHVIFLFLWSIGQGNYFDIWQSHNDTYLNYKRLFNELSSPSLNILYYNHFLLNSYKLLSKVSSNLWQLLLTICMHFVNPLQVLMVHFKSVHVEYLFFHSVSDWSYALTYNDASPSGSFFSEMNKSMYNTCALHLVIFFLQVPRVPYP